MNKLQKLFCQSLISQEEFFVDIMIYKSFSRFREIIVGQMSPIGCWKIWCLWYIYTCVWYPSELNQSKTTTAIILFAAHLIGSISNNVLCVPSIMAPSTVNSSLEFLYSCSEIQENRKKKHEQEEAVQKKIYGSKAQKKIFKNDWFSWMMFDGFTMVLLSLRTIYCYYFLIFKRLTMNI